MQLSFMRCENSLEVISEPIESGYRLRRWVAFKWLEEEFGWSLTDAKLGWEHWWVITDECLTSDDWHNTTILLPALYWLNEWQTHQTNRPQICCLYCYLISKCILRLLQELDNLTVWHFCIGTVGAHPSNPSNRSIPGSHSEHLISYFSWGLWFGPSMAFVTTGVRSAIDADYLPFEDQTTESVRDGDCQWDRHRDRFVQWLSSSPLSPDWVLSQDWVIIWLFSPLSSGYCKHYSKFLFVLFRNRYCFQLWVENRKTRLIKQWTKFAKLH